MRKTLDGSKMARGRKNLRNIAREVPIKAMMLAQMMRRRILLTGVSGVLWTIAPAEAFAAAAFGMPLVTPAVGVEVVLAAPGATRAAGGVAAGISVVGDASPAPTGVVSGALAGGLFAGGVAFAAGAFVVGVTSPRAAASSSLTDGEPAEGDSFFAGGVPGALSSGGVGFLS